MIIKVSIGTCSVMVDDGNAAEPASLRWSDQFARIKEAVVLATQSAVEMHKQQVGDVRG